MPNTLREKLIEILKKDIEIIGWSDTKPELLEKLYSNIADQILSLIIEKLLKVEDCKCTCGCNFKGACLCKEKRFGYNAYRKELIKMLKGV